MPTRKRREREEAKQLGQRRVEMEIKVPSKLGVLRGIGAEAEHTIDQREAEHTIDQRLSQLEAALSPAQLVCRLEEHLKARQAQTYAGAYGAGCDVPSAPPAPANITKTPPLLVRIQALEKEYYDFRSHAMGRIDELSMRILRIEEALGL